MVIHSHHTPSWNKVVKGEIRDVHELGGEKQSKRGMGKKTTADSVGSDELGGV